MNHEDEVRSKAIGLRPGEHKINCPACRDSRSNKKDASLSVNIKDGIALYNCHYCETTTPFKGRIELYADSKPKQVAAPLQRVTQRAETTPLGVQWLEKRAISYKGCSDKVELTEAWFPELKLSLPAIAFCYRNSQGVKFQAKYRCLQEKTFATTKDFDSRRLFLIEDVDFSKEYLVVVGGEMDALSLRQCGINAVSIPSGEGKDQWIEPNLTTLLKFKRVVIWMDSDKAGMAATDKLAALSAKLNSNFVYITKPHPEFEDCKDANEMLMRGATSAHYELMIERAEARMPKFIIDPREIKKTIGRIRDGTYATKIGIGDPALDLIYSPTPGYVTLLTGIPNHGKTTWLNYYCYMLTFHYGWKFAVWSPENDPALHYMDFVTLMAGRRSQESAAYDAMKDDELWRVMESVWQQFKIIQDYESDTDIETILDQILTVKLLYGCNGVILDPWNYITMPEGMDERRAIRYVMGAITRFAKREGVHVWVVAHPTKMQQLPQEKTEGEEPTHAQAKYRVPVGYDVSGSADFYNMTDSGITVYREEHSTMIYCWKAKREFLGKVGACKLYFKPASTRFESDDMAKFSPGNKEPAGNWF